MCIEEDQKSMTTFALPQSAQKQLIQDIWQREAGGSTEGLTFWSPLENFASVGFNHSLWYPDKDDSTITRFARYAQKNGLRGIPEVLFARIPKSLNTRQKWQKALADARLEQPRSNAGETIQELQHFFLRRDVQETQLEYFLSALFQFNDNFQQMLENISHEERQKKWRRFQPTLQKRFQKLASQPETLNAMLDYLSFKGSGLDEGIIHIGRQQREVNLDNNWGLLQVLAGLNDFELERDALQAFHAAAENILERRVELWRSDQIWMAGWKNRLNTYLS